MLWESQAKEICRNSYESGLANERAIEIQKINVCWDFYNGDQVQYIRKYEDETQEEWELKQKVTWNYFKKIIDKYIHGVFGQKVTVTFEDENYQEIWDDIVASTTDEKTGINLQMMNAQKIAEVADTCLVMIRYDVEKGLPYFEPIDGQHVDFIPDEEDHNKIDKVIICYEYDSKGFESGTNTRYLKRIEIWDSENYVVAKYDSNNDRLFDKKEFENPYGFIPMAIFQPQKDHNSFWGISMADDICQINRVYNDLWTYLTQLCEMQTFSILLIKTHGSGDDITIGIRRMIKFENMEEGATADDAKYLTPNPDIEGVQKSILRFKDELTDLSSVPTSVTFSGSFKAPESGYALQIKREPIEGIWDQRKLSYGPSYNVLVQKAIKVYEIAHGHKSKEEASKEQISVSINFGSPPSLIPLMEKMAQDGFDLRHDLITQVDMMMEKYPDLTKEEAEKKLMENIIVNNRVEMASFGESDDSDLNVLELEEQLDQSKTKEELRSVNDRLLAIGRLQGIRKGIQREKEK